MKPKHNEIFGIELRWHGGLWDTTGNYYATREVARAVLRIVKRHNNTGAQLRVTRFVADKDNQHDSFNSAISSK